MAIAITYNPAAMTAEQYDAVVSRLDSTGAYPVPGRLYHVSFGDSNHLQVGEVWESQEDFEAFGQTIEPILKEVGVEVGQPEISQVHNILN